MALETVMGNALALDNEIDVDVYARGEDGRGVSSTTITYQQGDSGTTIPTGEWSSDIPTIEQSKYLWIKTIYTYNDGTTFTSYNVSYFALDGAIYLPSVSADGVISWTNNQGLDNPESVSIKGPQGDPGSVKFYIVSSLPTEDIENDAFYIVPTTTPTTTKLYDMYFRVDDHWEKVGDDLSTYATQSYVDKALSAYIAQTIHIKASEEDETYNLLGTSLSAEGDSEISFTGISYSKAAAASKGEGSIDGETITTNLFFDIS